VTVTLHGSGAGAPETVRSGAKYKFSVPPGTYQVIGWWGSRRVTVRVQDSWHRRRISEQSAGLR
jgi:hypothetical protein